MPGHFASADAVHISQIGPAYPHQYVVFAAIADDELLGCSPGAVDPMPGHWTAEDHCHHLQTP